LATNGLPEVTHPRIDFIKSVHFSGLGLDKTSAFVDRDALSAALKREGKLEIDLKASQRVVEHKDEYFVVAADFDLAQIDSRDKRTLISISASFSAKFYLSRSAQPELVHAFAQVEARLIFFPYLRHFISDITYRMSIDPIVLPMTSELERKP
jgi:preprotein translocase subunit SecB